jgi:probable addiction module antidote protein
VFSGGDKSTQQNDIKQAKYLYTDEDIKEYLNASFATGDNKLIAKALGDIAKIKGMSNIANATKLDRSSLYNSLTIDGDPKLSTLTKLIESFGYTFSIK